MARLTRRVEERIRMPSTRYVVVTGPSGSSLDDAAYLVGELRERSLGAAAVLLNRAVSVAPTWVSEIESRIGAEPDLGSALTAYRNEYSAREGQTRRALEELGGMLDRKTPLAALPSLRTSDPRVILVALAGELAGAEWVRG